MHTLAGAGVCELASHVELLTDWSVVASVLGAMQAVHTLEDVGDSELPALAGGEVLCTVKIINKEVRLASKVARAGMDRIRDAVMTVS